MRLPPKYGNGDSKGAIDLGVLPGFAELFGSFLLIALLAQTDDVWNALHPKPIHACLVRAKSLCATTATKMCMETS
jgi:hypothetical protein